MTPDEQAFMDRVDGALASVEARVPSAQRLRQIPMDMVAVSVMRQLARDGAVVPFSDVDLDRAVIAVMTRHLSAPSQFVPAG